MTDGAQNEILARQVYTALTTRFAEHHPTVSIVLHARNRRWSCTIHSTTRACRIDCHAQLSAPYRLGCMDGDTTVADGWAANYTELYPAITCWLAGGTLPDLYDQAAFLNREIRALSALEAQLRVHEPALTPLLMHEYHRFSGGTYTLCVRMPTRSCRITFMADADRPTAHFLWDDCPLFAIPVTESADLAVLLRRWLIESAAPSALEQEFPWLVPGTLAQYYEAGRGIEGEFVMSWERMAMFYTDFAWPIAPVGHRFVALLRSAGYDRCFRAGQSLVTLILSRSRRHYLRPTQPRISFFFHADATMNVTLDRADRGTCRVFYRLPTALTPALRTMLDAFARQPID